MADRLYLPTLAELIDRLSIVQMKAIFIPENKDMYNDEIAQIIHDIDDILDERHQTVSDRPNKSAVSGNLIRAALVIMLTNRYIWENESKARQGGPEQDKLLKLTHSINGVRNTAKNMIAKELGERRDLKIDALAAELLGEFGAWDIKWDLASTEDKND